MTYKVIHGYSKRDNTMVNKDRGEIIEYTMYKDISTFRDAREIMKAVAFREDMSIVDFWNAEKESIVEDMETGIIVKEREWLRIDAVA